MVIHTLTLEPPIHNYYSRFCFNTWFELFIIYERFFLRTWLPIDHLIIGEFVLLLVLRGLNDLKNTLLLMNLVLQALLHTMLLINFFFWYNQHIHQQNKRRKREGMLMMVIIGLLSLQSRCNVLVVFLVNCCYIALLDSWSFKSLFFFEILILIHQISHKSAF